MIPEEVKEILKKQHYSLVGNHSAVQICRWAKKSLRNEGVCYKEKFYGIKSHLCCQMTPSVMWCHNKCLHCWRAVELTLGDKLDKNKTDSPKKIINECIESQKRLLQGFKINLESRKKQLSRADIKKWRESQEPMQFAISLSGEPTLYKEIGELIKELRRRGKTSFLVTNGLEPEIINELKEKNNLPTQLYVSVNTPNERMYNEFHRSSKKDAWNKLNQTLKILPSLKCRTVFRINLIKNFNMNYKCIKEFAQLIKMAKPMFVELKGYMSVGFARRRLGYNRMPWHEDILNFSKKISKETELKILDEHEHSRVIVLGINKRELKIRKI